MMYRLWSTPPHTLGELSPASFATSTKVTGDVTAGFETVAASSRAPRFPFQSGVARASSSVEPRRIAEEPRNRRRRNFIYFAVFGAIFGNGCGTIPVPSFTAMILSMGTFAIFSTEPLGQVISRESILVRLPRPKKIRGSLADI